VLFSALVALTLTPMLASKLPPSDERNRFARGGRSFFRGLAGLRPALRALDRAALARRRRGRRARRARRR
jgi:multidrug efflux pump